MKNVINKFLEIEKEINKEKGFFNLFALFLREDSENKWDLIISATWFLNDEKKTLDYVIDKIKSKINKNEIINLSRIVLLKPNDPFVLNINSIIVCEHSITEFSSCVLNNMHIKHAFIITSKKN